MFFFSLPREKKQPKRELVARFESEQITILKNCAAGLAPLRQVLALPSASFFNHRICYLPLTSSNSLTLGIVHASMTLLSLNRDFLAITTRVPLPRSLPIGMGRDVRFSSQLTLSLLQKTISRRSVTNRTPRPHAYGEMLGEGATLALQQ